MIAKTLKDKWISALRSGDYPQADKVLCDGVGYCCLGVLAEVRGIEFEPFDVLKVDATHDMIHNRRAYSKINLITDGIPGNRRGTDIQMGPNATQLMSMNDQGVPFVEIADWIEENL